jgi:hypothetical protein
MRFSLIIFVLLMIIGCKKSKESEMKSFVRQYNNLKSEIIRGNRFVDTKATITDENTIELEVIISGNTKTAVKNFLKKYQPEKLTNAIDYIADPLFLLEQGAEFRFKFFNQQKFFITEKSIDLEVYKIYKKNIAERKSPDIKNTFYLKRLTQKLEELNENLPKTLSDNNIKLHKLIPGDNGYLIYNCSCSNTKEIKTNNRILKEKFSKKLRGFDQFKEVYLLMSEVNIKAVKFNCMDEDTKKPFDFVYYKKDILEMY